MKNLPDDDLFLMLKGRLEKFEEQPDEDVWETVSATLSSAEPGWIKNAERSGLILVFLLMTGSWYNLATHTGSTQTTTQRSSAAVSRVDAHAPPTPARQPASHSSLSLSEPKAPTVQPPATSRPSLTFPSSATSPAWKSVGRRSNGTHLHSIVNATSSDSTPSTSNPTSKHPRVGDLSGTQPPMSTTAPASTRMLHNGLSTASVIDSTITASAQTSEEQNHSASPIDRPIVVPLTLNDSTTREEPASVFNPKRRRKPEWRMYVLATPSLTFQQVVASTSDELNFARLNSPGVLSKDRFSFSFEGGVQLPLTKHLAAFAGLTWYQQSLDISLDQQIDGIVPSAAQGALDFAFKPNTKTTTINYNMRNVGITAGLTYAVSIGKIVNQFGGSLQYEYGLASTNHESRGQNTNHYINYRLLYRAEYGINDRLSVFIQPSFTSTLLHHDVLDGAIKVRQSRAGIGIGLLLKF